ncbi:MAG: hypothetical protein CR984_02860 [Proteobacteria bacterium]|nr:MAG: hypothetical protein CR984_02860 [Pseudomonadota bacterium]
MQHTARLLCGLILYLWFLPVHAPAAGNLAIIRLSSADRSAVIRTGDGRPILVKVGQTLDPFGKIVEIGDDRIICHTFGASGKDVTIIKNKNGELQISTITRTAGDHVIFNRSGSTAPGD